MKFKISILSLAVGLVLPSFSARVPLSDIQRRLNSKNSISLFMPWGGISGGILDTVPLHKEQKVALHDLEHNWISMYELKPINTKNPLDTWPGRADGFDPESVKKGLEYRKRLLALNPNIILIGEVRFYDAFPDYLPKDDPWWLRDNMGNQIGGQWKKLNYFDTTFQKHVAQQCIALLETGVVDGIFLDWATNSYLPFFKMIRSLIGDSAVIIGNTNHNVGTIEEIIPYLNGIFMESWWDSKWTQATYLDRIRRTIVVAERDLKPPKLINTEIWAQPTLPDVDNSSTPGLTKIHPSQMSLMRAGVTAHYTHTNGYVTFYPKTSLGPNHIHVFDDFFNAHLGQYTAGAPSRKDSAYVKEWGNGTVVYNPASSPTDSVILSFLEDRRSQATGKVSKNHKVAKGDGDIFLKSPYQQLYPAPVGFLSYGLPALRKLPDTNYVSTPIHRVFQNRKKVSITKPEVVPTKNNNPSIQYRDQKSPDRAYDTHGRKY